MSITFLLALTLWLVVEAFKRIFIEYEIDGEFMLVTAVLSLIFNIVMMDVLHSAVPHDHDHGHDHGHGHSHGHSHGHGHAREEKKEEAHSHGDVKGKLASSANQSKLNVEKEKSGNINIDAAYLHVLGDLLMSVGVTIAATVIYFFPIK